MSQSSSMFNAGKEWRNLQSLKFPVQLRTSQDVSVKYQIWPVRLFELFWSRPQPLSHAAVSHHLSARDVSHSEALLKASMKRYVQDLLIFCKQVGFGELWHGHSCPGWRLKISDDVFQWQHGTFLLLKVAFGEICLIIGISQKSVLFLISQSSASLLSLKDHLFATSRDCIFWNSSSAFCMKMPASSSETQKHDAMHVFIYSLCPQHVQHAIYLHLTEKEGKPPQTVMLTGCCCERDSDCGAFENMVQDVFQHERTRGWYWQGRIRLVGIGYEMFLSICLQYLHARRQHLFW